MHRKRASGRYDGINAPGVRPVPREVFDVFNHPNFANPASDVSTPSTFVKISAISVNSRIMQSGLKVEF